ncbi:MAG TPA: sodium:proline symporter [Lacunisphaera sp.]|nr:sodium:proline symporter [Lacunisphaera sp.]
MHALDWLVVALSLAVVVAMGAYAQRYMKGVADFMSGGRSAGRYLLTVARGEMFAGAVMFVSVFEMVTKSGFVATTAWWQALYLPIALIIGIGGFVIYRYRETRALTLSQFFEIRYSRRFRIFAGALGFFAGILNFGIIPAVGARFFVYFLELPTAVVLLGSAVPTYLLVMAVLLGLTLVVCLTGGFITMMTTDCVEGILSQVFYLVIIGALLFTFDWSQIEYALGHRPPGQSFLNPFDAGEVADFNFWFIVMSMFFWVYSTMAWQNSSGYYSAAINAHESRMGIVLGRWRDIGRVVTVTLLAVCAAAFLAHPDFAAAAAPAHAALDSVADPQLKTQLIAPVSLSHMLPLGIKGLLCAILLMGIFGGDSNHLHSWGGIFVQDVIMPLRRRPLTPAQHIRWLRWAMTGVALFAFGFGALFRQTEYIIMWWQVTTAVFVGGASSAIIGGLYWKKGTTAGAWVATLLGSVLSSGGILARQHWGAEFPLNGLQIAFFSSLLAITAYVVTSLLTCREDFNLERMLHRGRWVRADDIVPAAQAEKPSLWARLVGFDRNFTRGDKWAAGGIFGWAVFFAALVLIGTAWNFISPWSEAAWSRYWRITAIGAPIVVAVVTGIWFTWGATRDLRDLFRRLRAAQFDPADNGVVAPKDPPAHP